MRKATRIVAAAVLAMGVVGISAGSASAEEQVHRGKSGCFTYSYKQGGIQTNTTVYYHNTCRGTEKITIVPQTRGLICDSHTITVKGGDYGDYSMYCSTVRRVEGTGS